MAYGVKYRLEFSDVLGNGKKIEILKDGYSGSVLPLIGTDEPLSIKWDGDDDFYSPIIGSTCTINLFVTDDVQYDNFYAFDEEEYQVKIYFKNPTNTYILYWVGFIVTDSYKQAMASPPYQISLQAHDGIGLLDSKFIEINNGDGFTSAVGGTGRLRENLVNDCISKTNLGLDVYFCTGLRTTNNVSSGYLPDATAGFGGAKYDNDLKVVNCKEYIENLNKTEFLEQISQPGWITGLPDYAKNLIEKKFESIILKKINKCLICHHEFNLKKTHPFCPICCISPRQQQ